MGHHRDRVEHCLTQLRVVGHHLGAHCCLLAYKRGGWLALRRAVDLGVEVVYSVGDVAHNGRLRDGYRLGIEGREVLAKVGYGVHGDVADGLVAGGQLDRAGSGGGGQVAIWFGSPTLDDMIDCLDD